MTSGNVIPNYMTQPIIPKQQVIKVNGYEGAKNIRMREDSSIILCDEKEPIIYLCQTDGIGNVTVNAFDITPHKTEEQKQTDQILSVLATINDRLTRLEEAQYESVATNVVEPAVGQSIPEYQANQTNLEYAQLNGKSTGNAKTGTGRQPKSSRS